MTLKELKKKKINIMEYLRDNHNIDFNDKDIIKCSYDMQAGSYIKGYKNLSHVPVLVRRKTNDYALEEIDNVEYHNLWYEAAANIFDSLDYNSILDAGTGEATTLHGIMKNSKKIPQQIYGVDISLSRVLYASNFYSKEFSQHNSSFVTGNIFDLPFADSSIDLVFTCHAIEPNTNKEKDILQELYRVAKKYLLMIEPSYNLGSDATKENILKHKYITKLYSTAIELGYKVIRYELFDISMDKNMSEIIIIEKNTETTENQSVYACPICKKTLKYHNNQFYCHNCLLVYPVINNIPVLNREYGILCSKFLEF